jgi:hypothetical protein
MRAITSETVLRSHQATGLTIWGSNPGSGKTFLSSPIGPPIQWVAGPFRWS